MSESTTPMQDWRKKWDHHNGLMNANTPCEDYGWLNEEANSQARTLAEYMTPGRCEQIDEAPAVRQLCDELAEALGKCVHEFGGIPDWLSDNWDKEGKESAEKALQHALATIAKHEAMKGDKA